ncbi:hypothetical protein ACFVSU_06885 [Microbacterium sp. NPDC058062]
MVAEAAQADEVDALEAQFSTPGEGIREWKVPEADGGERGRSK